MTPGTRSVPRVTSQTIVGIGIIVFGLLFTAANLDWIDIHDVWRYWPLIVVAAGLARFFNARTTSARLIGSLFIFVGLWWLADNFHLVRVHAWDWWPLVLVAMGVIVIMRASGRSEPGTSALSGTPSPSADQVVSAFAFWSAVRRRVNSAVFRRADLTAVMGGIELDLRGASLGGADAVIDVFAVWGGIELRVPPDWSVSNQAIAIMGGVEDKTAATPDARQRLIVRGFVVMGGVEIKS